MGRFDTIVIGSGFGGSVMACRLAQAGQRVLVLERGRRWEPADYPRLPTDPWIYDDNHAARFNGWLDVRDFGRMFVVAGAGVGGGSLVYANVSLKAPAFVFENERWPREINLPELEPYYDVVGKMLGIQTIPAAQRTPRGQVLREAADRLGYGDRFSEVPLAINFDPDLKVDFNNPETFPTIKDSKFATNEFGKKQGTCVFLANCDLGCDVQAKNTLDLNYLALAEQNGVEVRPLHLVRFIKPESGGYLVHFDQIKDSELVPGNETADRVIVAAGSMGSTELLLRCRDQYRTLPKISSTLGDHWSSNGDFLTPAFYKKRDLYPAVGPTISSAVDLLDGTFEGQKFTMEDGGLPPVLENWVEANLTRKHPNPLVRLVLKALAEELRHDDPLKRVMPWFANGIDPADARFYLGRRFFCPWKRVMRLRWNWRTSAPLFNAIAKMQSEMSVVTGGIPFVSPLWTKLHMIITPHPVGGCSYGNSPDSGVVDHKNQVFGYENLYVVDGATIPTAIGRNPSRTIAALAERAAAILLGKTPPVQA